MSHAVLLSLVRPSGRKLGLALALLVVVSTGLPRDVGLVTRGSDLAEAASVADMNAAGEAAYARGDFVEAQRFFRQAIRQAPHEPLFHYNLGVTLTKLARWHEAANAYQAALLLDPPPAIQRAARDGLSAIASLVRSPRPRSPEIESTSIRLHRLGGNWFADVMLNGSHSARFLIDTGASTCVISPELAETLGIMPGPGARIVSGTTLGGPVSGPVVSIPSIRVGETEAENVVAVILPTGGTLPGILGNTFLARYTATLDPARGVLTLAPRQ